MPKGAAFVRIVGDGRAVVGPCRLLGLLWRCDKNDEECHVYDGLDATSGRLFARLVGDSDSIYSFEFDGGIEFAGGIYVDQTSKYDEMTVWFQMLE